MPPSSARRGRRTTSAPLVLTYRKRPFRCVHSELISFGKLARAALPLRRESGRAQPARGAQGLLKVPTGPNLGLEIKPEFLKQDLVDGEAYWA
jgi:hypothetical protein